jgi:hypothetical protein
MAIQASKATDNIIGRQHYLPKANGAPQFMEVELHVPILIDRLPWRGYQYIVGPEFQWEPSIGLYRQMLIRIEGETRFHIHRPFYGICYLCGCDIPQNG